MLGTEDEPGIMVLTLQELFSNIDKYSTERDYKIKLERYLINQGNDLIIRKIIF